MVADCGGRLMPGTNETEGFVFSKKDIAAFAVAVEKRARKDCAAHLRLAADRLAPEGGKRTNQYDRHMADVLREKADELLMRSNVEGNRPPRTNDGQE